jgi:hypothetical protein
MINVDMFVIEIANSKATVTDLWSTSEAKPIKDTK